jgi:hypothetical protein
MEGRGGQGVNKAGGASPVALWFASLFRTLGLLEQYRGDDIEVAVMPSAARVRIKVMVVILLIGIASPVLG